MSFIEERKRKKRRSELIFTWEKWNKKKKRRDANFKEARKKREMT